MRNGDLSGVDAKIEAKKTSMADILGLSETTESKKGITDYLLSKNNGIPVAPEIDMKKEMAEIEAKLNLSKMPKG